MANTVQTRLDLESRRALDRLTRRLGWTPSRVIREGIRVLDSCYRSNRKQRIVGLGKFSSGIPDLASNKAHLKGFGR